jgi:hypothetical protein
VLVLVGVLVPGSPLSLPDVSPLAVIPLDSEAVPVDSSPSFVLQAAVRLAAVTAQASR